MSSPDEPLRDDIRAAVATAYDPDTVNRMLSRATAARRRRPSATAVGVLASSAAVAAVALLLAAGTAGHATEPGHGRPAPAICRAGSEHFLPVTASPGVAAATPAPARVGAGAPCGASRTANAGTARPLPSYHT